MTRHRGLLVLACALLGGCAGFEHHVRTMPAFELPPPKAGRDPDMIATSLRPLPKIKRPKLPKAVNGPDLALKLKSNYARLQFQLPLLPRRIPMQLTAVARSYLAPASLGSLHGKFLFRLSLPLSSRKRLKTSTLSLLEAPAETRPQDEGAMDHCTEDGLKDRGAIGNPVPCEIAAPPSEPASEEPPDRVLTIPEGYGF